MTATFKTKVHCPRCNHEHSIESDFARWVRNHPDLSSNDGEAVSDFDYVFHRFLDPYLGRKVQYVMFVEVKICAATVSESQKKTLSIARQMTANQRGGTSRIEYVRDGPNGPWRRVRNFGGFCLRFSHNGPTDSKWIEWHGKRITLKQLVGLLRFDLDPFTLKKMDLRDNHHQPNKTPMLFEEQAA